MKLNLWTMTQSMASFFFADKQYSAYCLQKIDGTVAGPFAATAIMTLCYRWRYQWLVYS
jgi:hypothetical protein